MKHFRVKQWVGGSSPSSCTTQVPFNCAKGEYTESFMGLAQTLDKTSDNERV